jgi:small subunit ribosomal protein S18
MRRRQRRCRFCKNKVADIDYKDTSLLKGFINERGKILGAKITRLCAYHQRCLTQAIKRAREIALLPYEIH